jgi:hypothetical protein
MLSGAICPFDFRVGSMAMQMMFGLVMGDVDDRE